MTARAGLTVVGQVAGAFIGGPIGAAIGGAIGGMVGGAIDGPQRSTQALLDDLGALKFDYGSSWPRLYGVYRVKVAPIWSSEKRPVPHDEEVNSKGGPDQINRTFTYEQDWLCWAPLNATGWARIWINGKLRASRLADADSDTIEASAAQPAWADVTFFDGAADQLPWAVYEAAVGTANACAYRHRPTLAFSSLDLGSGGQPPLVEVEFFSDATESEADDGSETFSLWRVTQHDWGPISTTDYIYGADGDPPEVGAGAAAAAAQASYESVWGPGSRGPYLLDMPPTATSPLGEAIGYDVMATTGGKTCSVDRLYLGLSSGTTVYAPQPADLADIVRTEALLEWTGEAGVLTADDIDVTELASTPVRGFLTTSSPRESVAQLMDVFYFGVVCSDKLYHRLRGAASIGSVAADDTGAGVGSAGEIFAGLERGNDLEQAIQVAVTGPNVLTDYEPGTEISDRLVGESVELRRYTTAVVLTPAERKGRADTMVLDGRVASHTGQVALDDAYMAFEPFDVWTQFDDEGNSYRVRADRETYADGVRTFDVVLDDATVLSTSGITAETDSRALTVRSAPDTTFVLLDIPLLKDADDGPGFYVAVKAGNARWTGCAVYGSADDLTYTQLGSLAVQTEIGTCTTTLGDWADGTVFDETNSVTVDIGEQTLASWSRADILAGTATGYVIGNELIYAMNATLVSAGVYTLTGLLRGRRGTEWAMIGHAASERFVALRATGSGMLRVPLATGDIGVTRYYKAVTVGKALSTAIAQTLACAGISQKPFSPVDLRIDIAPDLDITIDWKRRSRMATRFTGTGGISVPLGETVEAYEVDILSEPGGSVRRTVQTSTPELEYTLAMQQADFGFARSVVYVSVCQMSTLGRGYPFAASLTVPTTSAAAVPWGMRPVMEMGGILYAANSTVALSSSDGGVNYTTARDDGTQQAYGPGVVFFDGLNGTQRISIGWNIDANFGGMIVGTDDPTASTTVYQNDQVYEDWYTHGYPRAGSDVLGVGALYTSAPYYYIVGRKADNTQPVGGMYLYRATTSLSFSLQGQLVQDPADPNALSPSAVGAFRSTWFTPTSSIYNVASKMTKFGGRWFLWSSSAIYYTDDSAGLTGWLRCPTGLGEGASNPPIHIIGLMQIGSTLFAVKAGTPNCLSQSADNGTTWTTSSPVPLYGAVQKLTEFGGDAYIYFSPGGSNQINVIKSSSPFTSWSTPTPTIGIAAGANLGSLRATSYGTLVAWSSYPVGPGYSAWVLVYSTDGITYQWSTITP